MNTLHHAQVILLCKGLQRCNSQVIKALQVPLDGRGKILPSSHEI